MLYMTVHGRPRFATVITDQWTIRLSFILGMLGAAAAAFVDWRARTRQLSGQGVAR
jgi:hypothetical protein